MIAPAAGSSVFLIGNEVDVLKRWRELEKLKTRAQGIHHRTFAVDPIQWNLNEEVLDFLFTETRPEMKTLEVGAGLSTLIFVTHRTSHLAFMKSPEQRERVLEVCMWEHLNSSRLEMRLEELGQVLANSSEQPSVDLVLFNDERAFPQTPLAWQKLACQIKTGGYLVLGSIKSKPAAAWFFFLRNHPHWQLEQNFSWRAAAFRKVNPSLEASAQSTFPDTSTPSARLALFFCRFFLGPVTGNCYWQKALGRWVFEELYLNGWRVFYEDVLLTLHLFVLRKFYYCVVRKVYFFTLHALMIQTYRLIFHLLPSWTYKAYAYGRTFVWMLNLPEWPGIGRMWFWRLIPLSLRRENLRRLIKRVSAPQSPT